MRRLTLRDVQEQYGGILPPDAVLRADDDEEPPSSPPIPRPAKPKRSARSQRFAVLNAFVDFGIASANLTPAEALVWLVLFRDTKAATGTACTGQADIARRANLSRRGVQVALDKLTAKGLVQLVRRGRLNGGPSTYRVHPTGTA